MNSLNEKFGIILRRHRLANNLSQEKLAACAGVHRTYISQIERGIKSPTIKTLNEIAKSLNITLCEICCELEE